MTHGTGKDSWTGCPVEHDACFARQAQYGDTRGSLSADASSRCPRIETVPGRCGRWRLEDIHTPRRVPTRSALNRATRKKGIIVATASDDAYLYVWNERA